MPDAARIDPPSPTAPIRIGVVGLGMAGGVMAMCIGTHPAFALAGAVEPDAVLRDRFAADTALPAFDALPALLARDDVDAVYVATPHGYHRGHAVTALEAGKHVIVEKPMALSLADCDTMIAAAERAARVLIVGHTHAFDPAVAMMRDLLREERLGPLAMVTAINFTDFLYRPRRPEELNSAKGGGILFNQVPHQVDVIRSLVDAPVVSVRAGATAADPGRPTEGVCSAFLQFANGCFATLVYSGQDGFDSDEWHDWTGEGGFTKMPDTGAARRRLRMLDASSEQDLRRDAFGYGSSLSAGFPPRQPHFGSLIATCAHGDLRHSPEGVRIYSEAGEERVTVPVAPWRPGRGDVLESLRSAIADGVPPLPDGRFGRETLAVCLAIQRSAQQRREVALSEIEELAHG